VRAILTYHSVDLSGSVISLAPAVFARHLAWLAAGGVRVVDLEALATMPDEPHAAALTFDDGFLNFATAAWPLLRDHGFPVTLFVVTRHAGGTNAWGGRSAPGIPTLPLLDWDALGRLAEEGVRLGAHSRTHRDLTRVGDADLEDEVAGSAADLAARTGRRPGAFAYPYGRHDARVERAAAPFACAVTTALRPVLSGDRAHALPRLDTYYLQRPGRLERFGTPAFARWLWLRGGARRLRAVLRSAAP
jgi:hypothetical protein